MLAIYVQTCISNLAVYKFGLLDKLVGSRWQDSDQVLFYDLLHGFTVNDGARVTDNPERAR